MADVPNSSRPSLPKTLPIGAPWPLIAVVTPSLNQGKYLGENIQSVLRQNYPHVEHVVIDRGSTDETAAVLRQCPVIFLHLPKAAGSTLCTIFRKMYGHRHLHHFSGNPDEADRFPSLPQKERHRIDLLTGHQHFGMHQWLRPGARYFTMLRDPVDRCISHYFFVLRRTDHYLHQRVVGGKMSLYDYVARKTTKELDNDQVRWLNEEGHRAVPFGGVTREMFEVAKHRLTENIEVFGLAERFDESLRMIAEALGWGAVEYCNENVTANRPGREEVDPRALDKLRECNRFDLELYEYAAALFAARVKRREMAAWRVA